MTVADRILSIISSEMDVPVSDLRLETSLHDDLGADDYDRLAIEHEIERVFDFEIPDEDAEGFRTVGDLVRCVERRMSVGESVG